MLLWLDLETTGLSPTEDHILEVAWTLTNDDLSSLGHVPFRSHVVTPSIAAWHQIEEDAFIQDMHGKTGLLDDLTQPGTVALRDVEHEIIDDIVDFTDDDGPVYLAGASVHFDLAFIRNWMPDLAARLSHRVYDTSTLKAFFGSLGINHSVENRGQHRAANDVAEVLEVARLYRTRVQGQLR